VLQVVLGGIADNDMVEIVGVFHRSLSLVKPDMNANGVHLLCPTPK
jgi:hypothetical protein